MERTADSVLLKPLTTIFAPTQPNDVLAAFPTRMGRSRLNRWRRGSRCRLGAGIKGADTNVIVRYLTGDDPQQANKVRAVIGLVEDAGLVAR